MAPFPVGSYVQNHHRVDRPPPTARPEVPYIPKISYINEPENFFKTFLQPARFDTWQTPRCQQAWLNFLPGQAREGRVGHGRAA
jgi:hypothetical protein